jgi:4-hydroxy-L-threonine phosphate dehydrogenase PdxA
MELFCLLSMVVSTFSFAWLSLAQRLAVPFIRVSYSHGASFDGSANTKALALSASLPF